MPAIHAQIVEAPQNFPTILGLDTGFTTVGPYRPLDKARIDALPPAEKAQVDNGVVTDKQKTPGRSSVLPMMSAT